MASPTWRGCSRCRSIRVIAQRIKRTVNARRFLPGNSQDRADIFNAGLPVPSPLKQRIERFPADRVVFATAADSAPFVDTETERDSFAECVLALGDPPSFIGVISYRMTGMATHVFFQPLFDHPSL